jgi:hypothetical protein
MTNREAALKRWESPAYRAKQIFAQTGKTRSPETVENNRVAHVGLQCMEKNPAWKGGRRRTTDMGYIQTRVGGKYRYEHALVAEKALGRPLKRGEVVHHINCDPADNRNTNLLICTNGYHRWLHEKMARAYAQEHLGGANA